MGDEMLQSVSTGDDALVVEELVYTGRFGLRAEPSGLSGSPGKGHEALEQPPWQDEVDPLW